MKNRSKFIKIFCFSICLFFSCGLDVIIYIEPPEVYNFRPEVYDEIFDIDWENRYFEFLTNENDYLELWGEKGRVGIFQSNQVDMCVITEKWPQGGDK